MNDKELLFTKTMLRAYSFFLSAYALNPKDFGLDVVVLRDMSKRYFKDVDRLHRYHGITHIDAHKIAGYTTYWLSKLKPISVGNSALYNGKSEFCVYINEIFALYLASGRIISAGEIKNLRLNSGLLASFLYLLKYRTTSGDNLSIMYYLIENARG